MSYVGQGDAAAHAAAGLVLDLHASKATGTSTGINSPATTIWKDLSSNNINANLINFDYSAESGWDNGKLTLDGIDDYLQIATNPLLDVTDELTIEVFVNNRATGGARVYYYHNGLIIRTNGESNLKLETGSNNITFTNIFINEATNYHIVLVKRTNGTVSVYVNGTEAQTATGVTITSSGDNVKFGNIPGYNAGVDTTEYYLLRRYNKSLTSDQVTQNYTTGIEWPSDTIPTTYYSYVIAPF